MQKRYDVQCTYLKNKKSIVVQIDIVLFETFCHLFKVHPPIVDGVKGAVVSVRLTRNNEFASGHNFVATVLFILDLGKMYGHTAAVDVVEHLRIVYQHRQFLATNLIRSIAKDKQHRIDDIRFATSIRTDNCMKTL